MSVEMGVNISRKREVCDDPVDDKLHNQTAQKANTELVLFQLQKAVSILDFKKNFEITPALTSQRNSLAYVSASVPKK